MPLVPNLTDDDQEKGVHCKKRRKQYTMLTLSVDFWLTSSSVHVSVLGITRVAAAQAKFIATILAMTSGTKCAVILVATLMLGSASAQLEYAANNASYGWIYGGEEGLENAQKPENWEKLEIGNCGGDSQSPIDIDTSSLSPSDNLTITSIDSVNFPNLNDSSIKAIKNLGKSVQLDMDDPSSATVTTNDGSVHALLQFHFHWGSEHKVDNERYPMEAHFVLNTSSVIGVLFQSTNSSDEVDSDVDSLIDNISNATNVNNNNPGEDQGGSPSDLNGSELATLLPSDTSFFYYSGEHPCLSRFCDFIGLFRFASSLVFGIPMRRLAHDSTVHRRCAWCII